MEVDISVLSKDAISDYAGQSLLSRETGSIDAG
jgi:hypothetical protein